jgi:arylsulfatase A-like enzyme
MSTRHPNVVVVVMDTVRARTCPSAGDGQIGTTLTGLAKSGTAYSNAFATAPWTLPSHGSLFTGQYPSKHGAHADHKRLPEKPVTLAEQFRTAGYETVAVSNNTWISEEFGFGRGFETFFKTWQYAQTDTDLGTVARSEEGTDALWTLGKRLFDGNPFVNALNAVYGKFFRKQYDDGAKRTNQWIESWVDSRAEDRPFFLFVNYLEPHLAYDPPKTYAEPFLPDGISYQEATAVPQDAWGYIAGTIDLSERELKALRALYRGEIAYLDEQLGNLRDALASAGALEDTVFVVTSDHGENIGDHGLMDHQYSLYDTLIHVPLVVDGGSFANGGVRDELVSLVDLAPTLLDEADIEPTDKTSFQGRSFRPNADSDPRSAVFAEYCAPQPPMEALERRVGEISEAVERFDRSLRTVRTDTHKFVRGSDGSTEAFDLTADPGEQRPIGDGQAEHVATLESTLEAWLGSFETADVSGDVSMQDETRDRLEDLGYLQ